MYSAKWLGNNTLFCNVGSIFFPQNGLELLEGVKWSEQSKDLSNNEISSWDLLLFASNQSVEGHDHHGLHGRLLLRPMSLSPGLNTKTQNVTQAKFSKAKF